MTAGSEHTSGWRRLGLVLSPTIEATPEARKMSHAAVPTVLLDERARGTLFFSYRDELERSHTARVALDENLMPLGDLSGPIIAPGAPGLFDDAGAMLSWVTPNGSELYGYYIGWNRGHSVPFRNALGLAVSTDGGRTFEKYSDGPILDRSEYDPCFVASACVLRDCGAWRMWYLSCVAWEQTTVGLRHRYHIKYAESDDGMRWRRDGRVAIDFAAPDEYAISRPCVVKDDDRYRMWYSYRGDAYRIGYAESDDGLEWKRLDDVCGLQASGEGWESEMVEYPFVFDHAGKRYMAYNGNGYGLTGIGLAELVNEKRGQA